jgi:S1-C subfamily serine protease
MSQYPYEIHSQKKRSGWLVGCAVFGVIAMCLVGVAVIGGYAWLFPFSDGESEVLSVEVSTPAGEIRVGDEFQVSVALSNEGSRNITISEIQLPNGLLENAQLIGVDPAGQEGLSEDDLTPFDFSLLIAPAGREMVVFRFQALNPVDVSGEIGVQTEQALSASRVRVVISPAAAAAVEPTATQTIMSEIIPYRAVVQIVAIVDLNGQLLQGWTGSGTIISEDGLILTNAHVVLSDRFYDVVDLVVSITTAQDQPPEPMFYADVVQADFDLDIAVIKIRSDLDGAPANFSALGIEPVRIGQADGLQLGDPIIILGYPGIGGETITLTRGEVSGFTAEAPYGNRAFIKTSATIAGGNSGGLAANSQGEIIGIPTEVGSGELEGVIVDCRPLADTNRDGFIDESDNCVPTGGFINALRPVNLALPLIDAAQLGQVAIYEEPVGEAQQEYEQEGDVLLFDDFSDNRNGWYLSEYTDGSVDITGSQLVVDVGIEKTYILTYLPDTYTNLIMVTEAEVLTPAGDGDFGFICGYVDDDNFTALEVSEDDYYAIWNLIDGEMNYLVEWTPTDMIPSSGTITLAAYCGEDGFALAVDDMLLAEADALDYQPGRVGVFTGTWNEPNLSVGFNGFAILEP